MLRLVRPLPEHENKYKEMILEWQNMVDHMCLVLLNMIVVI